MSRFVWTDEAVALLRRLYADTPTNQVAALIGVTPEKVYHKVQSLGIRKSPEYMASEVACRLRSGDNVGAATRFRTGIIPWNKGKKHPSTGRAIDTQFKPGNRSGKALALHQPIGAERISKDGYLERKIHEGRPYQSRWRAVHLLEWEAINGPLPAGHAVVFRDGNKRNLALDNLELVTRAELMRRNSVYRYGQEIAQLSLLRGKITKQINKRKNHVG